MQNFPFNGQIFTNDIAVNDTYPKVQFGGSEPGAVYFEDVEVAGTMYQKVQNASYNKWSSQWLLVDPTKPAYAIQMVNGVMQSLVSPAGLTPFSAWQVSGNIVSVPSNAGINTLTPADGSSSVTIALPRPFRNSTNQVVLSIGANYTGTDNAIICARLTSVPTKSSFTAIVSGGQTGTTVDLHYLALGT